MILTVRSISIYILSVIVIGLQKPNGCKQQHTSPLCTHIRSGKFIFHNSSLEGVEGVDDDCVSSLPVVYSFLGVPPNACIDNMYRSLGI